MVTPSHGLEIWPQIVADAVLAQVTSPNVPKLAAMRGISPINPRPPELAKISGARNGNSRGPETYRSAFRGVTHGKRHSEQPDASRSGRHTSSRRSRRWRRSRRDSLSLTPTCSSSEPGILIVAHPGDLVAHMVSTMLRYDQIPVWEVDPHDLGSIEFDVRRSIVHIQDCPVRGLLLRPSHCLNSDPTPTITGRLCGDPAVTASWLAAASLGAIRVINSYDSESWRNGAGWSVWERRLSSSGVPIPNSSDPNQDNTQVSLLVCGDVVAGEESEVVHAAGEVLQAAGVRLAEVSTLANGAVAAIDTQPNITNAASARRAAVRIIDYVAA